MSKNEQAEEGSMKGDERLHEESRQEASKVVELRLTR
jgi:hypothetical protein